MAFHHFSNGAILMLDGNYIMAAEEFEKALTYEPHSRETRISLGECYFNLREFEKALAVVSAIDIKDGRTWKALATYYRGLNREQEAYDAYRRVIEVDSADADAYWYLVQLEMQQGQMDSAVALMERLTQVRRTPRMMVELGRLYHRAGRMEDASELLQKVIDGVYGLPPGEAFELQADLLAQLGRHEEATAVLHRGIILFPELVSLREKLIDAQISSADFEGAAEELAALLQLRPRPQDYLRMAELYFQLGRSLEADSLYKVVADSNPDVYLPHLRLGQLKMMRGELDSARIHLARAVEIDDEMPDAYLSWANSYIAQDSIRRAIDIAREGEGIAQPRGRLQFFIGVSYSRLHLYDSAIVWLEAALGEEPAELNVRFSLGAAYERAGRFTDADTTFQQLIAVDSNHAGALNYLGYMYAEEGIHLDVSLLLIERAVALEPENSAFLDSYAWILYRLDRIDEAAVQIRKAFEFMTIEDPVMYDHYGDILARQGEMKQARDQWAKALELDPENDTIKEKLHSRVP
jgi:tetratricopeptide (TPR) repeat protein